MHGDRSLRDLLAVGISGGLLPCPTALVVLLAAISLHRVGYGLVLIVAFSLGLAGAMTAVGLAAVSARRFLRKKSLEGRLVRASARRERCADPRARSRHDDPRAPGSAVMLDGWIAGLSDGTTIWLVLLVAVLLGLRHATDPDHLAAVTTLVAGGKTRVARQAGELGLAWGAGHATTLFVFGLPILLLNRYLPVPVEQGAETAIGLVIVYLAVRLLVRWKRGAFHPHGDGTHVHVPARTRLGAYGDRARARPGRKRGSRRVGARVRELDRLGGGRSRASGRLHGGLDVPPLDGLRPSACVGAPSRRFRRRRTRSRRPQPRVRDLVRLGRVEPDPVRLLRAA